MATTKFVSQANLATFAAKVKEEIDKQITAIPEVPLATDEKAGVIIPSTGLEVAEDGKVTVNFKAANDYTDEKVAALVGGAPETLDTLNEIAKALGEDENLSTTLTTKIGENKAAIEAVDDKADNNAAAIKAVSDDYFNSTNLVALTAEEMADLCETAFA